MAANSNIQLTTLDFDLLKSNFLTYLQSQSSFQDYNFEGSALNTLVDLLVYNTQYNSYYLNMVANEMFLDSATQRSSVVSHAKLLNYTPKSAIAPTATVNVAFTNVNTSTLTLPAYSVFSSAAINGVNYTFVNTDAYTVNVVNNTAIFPSVQIKQGVAATYSYTVDSSSNPNYIFEIPDSTIDTTTLKVIVQQSSSNSSYSNFTQATNSLTLDGTSQVYFLQESLNGNYQIYFGNGVLGQQLTDGNIVSVAYISTEGNAAAGANSFVLMQSVSGYSASSVNSVYPASTGSVKESIDSIKFQAPKAYAAQGRAVTKEDYITAIQQNTLGYAFDGVNVWGGQENDPPVYGQVFVSLKPKQAYSLSASQKQNIIDGVLKPISVLTVEPTIVDPDYTYIKLTSNVLYDPKKTNYTANQIQSLVTTTINNFSTSTLNTFNSTFSSPTLTNEIQNIDSSIITNEVSVQVQKKFNPSLTATQSYKLYYGVPLKKGEFLSGVSSSPALQFANPLNLSQIIDGIYIEEVPPNVGGVNDISILNPGFGYQQTPTVTILGDGSGATAEAVINTNGTLSAINVLTAGNNYTSAIATITPASNDTTGQGGAAVVNLQSNIGTLRTYYFDNQNVKTIFNSNVGTIDYNNGLITLNAFNPIDVDNTFGQLTITANPTTSIISSSFNRIITVDTTDSTAITVNVTTKNS